VEEKGHRPARQRTRASAGWDSTLGPWPEGMDEAVATRGHFYFFNFAFTQ